ncbi:hypothetical protein JCM10213v2_003769 [Rhodosporidiobolus nylandii]
MTSSANLVRRALEDFALGNTTAAFDQLLEAKSVDSAPSTWRRHGVGYSGFSVVSTPEISRFNQTSILITAAKRLQARGEYSSALTTLRSVDLLWPDIPGKTSGLGAPSNDLLWSLANLRLEARRGLGQPEDMAFSLSLLSLEPDSPDLRYLRVLALYYFGQVEEALSYGRGLAETAHLKSLLQRVTRVRSLRSSTDAAEFAVDAVELTTELLDLEKENRYIRADAFVHRADNQRALERHNLALDDSDAVLKLYKEAPNAGASQRIRHCYVEAYYTRARVHLALDNPNPALELLKREEDDGRYTAEERKTLMTELQELWDRKTAAEKEEEQKRKKRKAEEEEAERKKVKKDYHAVLGISPSASLADVSALYKRLCLIYHPDKGGNDAKMKEINEAYEAIKKALS